MTDTEKLLSQMMTNHGKDLGGLSRQGRVLLIFLRHLGCIFCMEALSDISKLRKEIESRKVQIVFVHMADNATADKYLEEFGLGDIGHISDPECIYYNQFGLTKGRFNQLFGLKVWLRTAQVSMSDTKRVPSKRIGDGYQMPGAFLLENEKIIFSFVHRQVSDKPDYVKIAECCHS